VRYTKAYYKKMGALGAKRQREKVSVEDLARWGGDGGRARAKAAKKKKRAARRGPPRRKQDGQSNSTKLKGR